MSTYTIGISHCFAISGICMDLSVPIHCVPSSFFGAWNQDYFNVIDTPMDFGTICSNLQNGSKYMNSEDVFKDVQFIWRHWCKYSNKGDYVLELMRCVKKKFMKYWIAAGLYNEQTRKTNGENFMFMLLLTILIFTSSHVNGCSL
jgi:hypothetical protein